ncbi:hypothetical protein CH278_01210 [Rhodococcus sp. 05-2254-5]|uniref:hypothetical protein n=1 Tax=unclassified Rhodococcus (in: high G+C Gram-positive bacteria) TaxID=192944 RepID=UPI000B9C3EED|nr:MULTISPECIES: hypothetical protein [unclassified Rhodococcus (in: high G+C Gram-positive bacteria)]OZE38960.1 hypothetical protein CH278_01210 [Rhodococcus sp. 05-2254-5]OZE58899.1 hypothetical protein CH269_07705 [Rhodococcus sp. 05-2254-1]
MADSMTTHSSDSESSFDTVKLLTHRGDAYAQMASAVVMVTGRSDFTPGGDTSAAPVPAINVVAAAISNGSARPPRTVKDLGDAIWLAIRQRMLADCGRCTAAHQAAIDDAATWGYPLDAAAIAELEVECDIYDNGTGHEFALHVAGFDLDGLGPVAMRYYRRWTRPDQVFSKPMVLNCVYQSAQERDVRDLDTVKHVRGMTIDEGSLVFRELKKVFLDTVRDWRMESTVGGLVRTTVLKPMGESFDLGWSFETG